MTPELLTLFHVLTGTLCVAAGGMAFLAPKGKSIHRAAGSLFLVSMLATALSGAVIGLLEPDRLLITAFAGLLAAYLVLTGWRTARWRTHRPGAFEWTALAAILVGLAGLATLAVMALQTETGRLLGFAAEDYLLLAMMTAMGAVADLTLLVRGTVSPRHRIARHLWRMGLAYFIAVGSFFTGPGARIFPEALRESGWLSLPEGLTALLILGFLARTLFKRSRRHPGAAS
ncbi:DUF2306 domain-containing protein [Maricaulis maris]|uniref:Putative membrane protein DUF2306 n=1 Tax=Maricaulis maris TaxID=74318 RepID=A0A495D339_9PROT|nr:DUF2306 domain-containing protein [Maricaulis maris]RKQ96189.1 putative membrane protein DUF2306 [Maricaulis maris]